MFLTLSPQPCVPWTVSHPDCFVSLWLPTASHERLRTRTVSNCPNPEWNETFAFQIQSKVKVSCGGLLLPALPAFLFPSLPAHPFHNLDVLPTSICCLSTYFLSSYRPICIPTHPLLPSAGFMFVPLNLSFYLLSCLSCPFT